MPTANIHIGAGKCGSTLIQGLLNEPDAREILPQEYLPHLSQVIQSHTPATEFEDYFYRQILDQIRGEMPRKDVVLSCENLFGVFTHKPNCYRVSVQVIAYLFQGFDIRLFVYVRRQDTWLEAIYGQDVKRQETRSVKEYMDAAILDNMHWDAMCNAYGEAFDLTVRPFEKHVLQTGGYRDFVDALFQWLGVKVEIENLPVINPSLSSDGLEIQMLANRILPQQTAYELSSWLERRCPKKPEDRHHLIDDNTEILRFFRESNSRLFDTHLKEFDREYYLG